MIVYKIHNILSNKLYVGKTKRSLEVRWAQHCSDARNGSDLPLHRAIRKHLPETFTVSVLDTAENEYDLNERTTLDS